MPADGAMSLNDQYFELFLQNWAESSRAVKRLNSSLVRLAPVFPLSAESLLSDDEELHEKLDAFRIRFVALQDCIGNKLFRNLLRAEDEEGLNMADTLSRMEKRQILSSSAHWRMLCEVRNSFSHDYPESEKQRAEALNLAWQYAPDLIGMTQSIQAYIKRLYAINMDDAS